MDDSDDISSIVAQIVNDQPDMECVATLSSADHLVEKASEVGAEVVLLDLTMPGMSPLEAMKDMAERYPGVRVIVVSGYDDEQTVQRAVDHGAWGYASKSGELHVLIDAIRSVSRGNPYFKV